LLWPTNYWKILKCGAEGDNDVGTGLRIFTVDDDDYLHRVSQAKFKQIHDIDSNERYPEYAGKRVRFALVLLDTEDRIPKDIQSIDCIRLAFDKDGRLDKSEYYKMMKLAMDSISPLILDGKQNNVVKAEYKFARIRSRREYGWEPSEKVIAEILRAVFKTKKP
jgi:hypothetical protein